MADQGSPLYQQTIWASKARERKRCRQSLRCRCQKERRHTGPTPVIDEQALQCASTGSERSLRISDAPNSFLYPHRALKAIAGR